MDTDFGKRWFRVSRVGRNASSAFNSLMFASTLFGTSPCRFNVMSCFSMASKTGKKSSSAATPDAEFVVTPSKLVSLIHAIG